MKFLFLYLLLFTTKLWGQALSHRYQHDYFLKRSPCGGKQESELSAIRFSFEHRNLRASRPIILNVSEQSSGFTQTLIFNTQNWFYPSFNGHHEFQPLTCSRETCRAEFFVFLSESVLAKTDWFYRLVFFDDKAFHEKLAEASLGLRNKFEKNPKAFFKETKVVVEENALVATVELARLRKLISDGYDVLLMWQLKDTADQQQYREVSVHLDGPASLAKLSDGTWRTALPTKPLSYVGFLVYARKDDQAYESKIEVRNSRDSFYNCQ